MNVSDAAYIAGLFDGEGSVTYKQYMRKRKGKTKAYPTWSIELEISMTDKEVIRWVYETLNVGSFSKRPPHKASMGKKMQWRWRCSFRDALYVAKLLWPYAIVKLHKLESIIDHYEPKAQELGDNIIDLETEREYRKQWPFK